MAVGILLSSLRGAVRPIGAVAATLALTVTLSGASLAQQPAAQKPNPATADNADCAKIPGGNAPLQRMARLQGGMSVRNLELTYFEMPLYALTPSDISYLRELWPQCGTFEADVADKIASKLSALISDAKGARQDSLDWISKVEADIAKLQPGDESIRKIHDLWQEMLNREFEMLQGDLQYLAKKLSEKRDALYAGQQQRQRTLVNPFDPGAPDTRDIKE
ncbi:MAG: hypothetical protein P1U88_08600 [Thalassobaculaceae bacterium]|nr:hypothetical protein [Thalassobaculaceae bacterium]